MSKFDKIFTPVLFHFFEGAKEHQKWDVFQSGHYFYCTCTLMNYRELMQFELDNNKFFHN